MEPLIILIVEDDEITRKALVRMFARDTRVRVVDAADGMEALGVLEAQPIDVVITDEIMPRINGLRLLETIKGRWPGTRRILYSGAIDTNTVLDAINRGGVDKALSKGGLPEQFRGEVNEIIEQCLAKRLSGAPAGARGSGTKTPHEDAGRPADSVLVISDELAIRHAIEETLRADGLSVRSTGSGRVAAALEKSRVDVAVLDLSGPLDVGGALRGVREVDLDCPVVVTVARGDVERAHEALRLGAHRYLVHPVGRDVLAAAVHKAATLHRLSRARKEAVAAMGGADAGLGDRAGLEVRFQRALDQLFMVYQPIVSFGDRSVMGYEALVRSEEPSMPHPGLLFDAAKRLDRLDDLGCAIRKIVHVPFVNRTDTAALFVNLHVTDVSSPDLLESELAGMADRVVLELTERASLESISELDHHISALRAHGYRIAVDDLGAGYAGLSAFAMLDPDLVKLDMSLVRNVHESATKRRLVKSLQDACADLGVPMIAEGVETIAERDALVEAGCQLFQGFLFARPARELPPVNWG